MRERVLSRLPNNATVLKNGPPALSPGGKRILYVTTDTATGYRVVLEGQAGPVLGAPPLALAFSADGSRFAWLVNRTSPNHLFLDGVEQGYNNASILFAPNSRHAVVFGRHDKTNRWGMFVDDTLVHDGQKQGILLNFRAFTPDSRHLYWTSRQPQSGQRDTWRLHLDGKPVV